jgi:hypothetical protein
LNCAEIELARWLRLRRSTGWSFAVEMLREVVEQYGDLYERWLAWDVTWSELSFSERSAIDVMAYHLTLYLDTGGLS